MVKNAGLSKRTRKILIRSAAIYIRTKTVIFKRVLRISTEKESVINFTANRTLKNIIEVQLQYTNLKMQLHVSAAPALYQKYKKGNYFTYS
jgi:3-phenylpropionate/cinnamic acid dioxygenase small subunit